MRENNPPNATIVVDAVGAVSLYVGDSSEPVFDAATNTVVIRYLMRLVRYQDRPMTVATVYPSGHRTLHRFAPDGTVAALQGDEAGATPSPGAAAVPTSTRRPLSRGRSGIVAVAAAVVGFLAVIGFAGLLSADSGDGADEVAAQTQSRLPAAGDTPTSGTVPSATPTTRPDADAPTGTSAPGASSTTSPGEGPGDEPTRTPAPEADSTTPAGEGPGEEPVEVMQPAEISVTERAEHSVTLSWPAATADLDLRGYFIYVDGVQVTQTPETTVTIANLEPGTTYTLAVATCDVEGNVSEQTTMDVVTEEVSSLTSG